MSRPIEAQIHPAGLLNNLQRARAFAQGAKIWAVVKADAYGHGIEHVYDSFRSVDGFALLDIGEAQRLRQKDWRGPILLLEGVFEARDLEWCSQLRLSHVVHHALQLDWLANHKTEQPHHVLLKINTGMNRLGFQPSVARSVWARLCALPQVDEVGLMTHFSDADGGSGIAHQVELFQQLTADLPGERSLCNSAALLRHAMDRSVRADWVRPGVMLYGSAPDYPLHTAAHWGLAPAMTLRSQLIGIQDLLAGDTVGYGSTYRAEQAGRIGIVACGYADGYPRHASETTPVLVAGQRTHIVGRVSMDMLCVDLAGVPQAEIGSEVVLWGRAQSGALLDMDEVAYTAGTISYELMCALAERVPTTVID